MELKVLESRPLADQTGPALFKAWLAGDERACRWLGPSVRGIEALARTAKAVADSRASAPCIVTGQQSHWLGGPAFVLFKAAMARALAARLRAERGDAVAAWFWSHSDDADTAEVDHVHVVNSHFDVQRFALGMPPDRRPLYARPLPENAASVFAATFEAMLEGPHKQALAQRLAETLRCESLANHFTRWLALTHPEGSLRVIEPRDDRAASARVVACFLRRARECFDLWREVDRACRDAAWDPPFDPWTAAPFFLLDGERRRIAAHYDSASDRFAVGEQQISGSELAKKLEDGLETAIPGALLRVALQSEMLPVAAYVGGPAEISYQAYALCLFDVLEQIRPVLVPRLHATLVSASSQKQLERFAVQDILSISLDALVAALPESSSDPEVSRRLDELEAVARRVHAELAQHLRGLDASLARSLEHGGTQMVDQVEKTRTRIAKVVQNRAGTGARQARKLAHWIRPLESAQERVLAATQLIARIGFELPDALVAVCDPFDPTHRILTFEEA